MAYTSNPFVKNTRREAVNDVRSGRMTISSTARHYGVARVTVYRWLWRAPKHNRSYIETASSKPHHHPNQLPEETVKSIIDLRLETGRCAPIIHAMLRRRGVLVSLASVKRILKRYHLTRRKRQVKPRYARIPRPVPAFPGSLVEMDTIHYVRPNGDRFYIYAVVDVCSRYGYAEYREHSTIKDSLAVARKALRELGFRVSLIQTDNGAEFGEGFFFGLRRHGIALRHTRVRKPNDNAHVERFVRTIQEECFDYRLPDETTIKQDLQNFVRYYNNERLHLGINCLTPYECVAKVLS